MSWWAITAGPLLLGTDLTNDVDPIDCQNHFDYLLLQNDEVLAIDQAGISGAPVSDYLHADPEQKNGSLPEIWRSKQPDGTYAVVLSNLASTTQNVTANWTSFGFRVTRSSVISGLAPILSQSQTVVVATNSRTARALG